MFEIFKFAILLVIQLNFIVEPAILPPDALVQPSTQYPPIVTATQAPASSTTRLQPICSYNGYWLNCSSFNSFEQLSANFRNGTYRPQELLIVRPNQRLDLDDSFDLTGYSMQYASLELSNINSFPFIPDPNKNINGKSLYIKESNLNFMHNGNPVNSQCNSNLFSVDSTAKNFFASFRSSITLYKNNNLLDALCPYLFKDINIDLFTTHIPLKFLPYDGRMSLNVNLRGLDLTDNDFVLDSESINPNIFGNLTHLRMRNSNLNGIDRNFFLYSPKFQYISFGLLNLKEFLQTTDVSWMKYINNHIRFDITNTTQVSQHRNKHLIITLIDQSDEYTYPDEDFCLFKDFPFNNYAFFQIDTKANLTCSCTIYWLYKHKNTLSFDLSLSYSSTSKCFSKVDLDEKIRECNFEERLEACKRETTIEETTTEAPELTTETDLSTSTSQPEVITANSTQSFNTTHHGNGNRPIININFICNNCKNLSIVNNIDNGKN